MGGGYRKIVRVEFAHGQIEHVEAAASAMNLPLEEFARRAIIEAVNTFSHSPTKTTTNSWGSLRVVRAKAV